MASRVKGNAGKTPAGNTKDKAAISKTTTTAAPAEKPKSTVKSTVTSTVAKEVKAKATPAPAASVKSPPARQTVAPAAKGTETKNAGTKNAGTKTAGAKSAGARTTNVKTLNVKPASTPSPQAASASPSKNSKASPAGKSAGKAESSPSTSTVKGKTTAKAAAPAAKTVSAPVTAAPKAATQAAPAKPIKPVKPIKPEKPTKPVTPKATAPKSSTPKAAPAPAAAASVALQAAPQAKSAPSSPATGKDEQDAFAVQSLDIEKLATNLARVVENSGKALAAYLQPRETGEKKENPDGIVDLVKTLGHVAEYWLKDPQRTYHAQSTIAKGYMDLWANTVKSMSGETAPPVVSPSPSDKRFKDPEWSSNPVFDFMKQFYLVTSNWADELVTEAEIEPHLKHKASFYTKQITGALSPSNFAITNPEVLRETFKTNGENLVRGTEMLAEDISLGHGDLKIRQSDETPFEMGRNIAVSPGKVIYENELIQLLQYEPSTPSVGRIPLLIVPPWINKFYILDLSPEKSFIKWAVDQGLSVFVISWVNPDARLAKKSFAEYIKEGPLAAIDVINQVTGIKEVHTIGYCVGGTLMACTLGYMAEKGDNRIVSNTFFTTQVDFTYAGDLLVFADEENIASVERQMQETGYLEGSRMANAFNMLRSNDLIWPYVVNNYLKGKKPMPFDLLYWNADSTRMPAANHSFYLRHCYLQNDLSNGRMEIDGIRIDLKKVKTPIYNLAAREDHIAPARSVFVGSAAFGGPVTYVMSGSGHIAGVVNPPSLKKYQFWTGGPVKGSFDDWVSTARETPGSWWPHWREWVRSHDGKEVKALKPGAGPFKAIEDAPGRYVKVKS